jgi:hypothetical protein
LLSIFVREKIFRSLPSHKKKSVALKSVTVYCLQFYVRLGPESPSDERQIMEEDRSVTEGTCRDSCSGKTKFETWKEKSKRKQIDTE